MRGRNIMSRWMGPIVLAAGTTIVPCFGQTASKPSVADPAPVALSQDPFVIESLGLSLFIPDGAAASTSMTGDVTATIYDREALPRWQVVISSRATSNAQLTPEELVDQAAQQLLEVNAQIIRNEDPDQRAKRLKAQKDSGRIDDRPVDVKLHDSEGAIIDRQPKEGSQMSFRASNGDELPFARVYVALPQIRGKFPVVRGITAVKVSPTQFVLFELLTTGDVFKDFRQTYETSVASSTFNGVAEAGVQRAEMISAGLKIIQRIDSDALIALAERTPERWERYYKPASDGKQINDEEVGYRRVKVRYGRRGNGRGTAADTRGVIVEIDARFIEKRQLIDSKSWFFLTPDRQEENWEVTMAVRSLAGKAGETPSVLKEVGARMDREMTVRVEGNGPTNTIKPEIAGEGYISRVESFLMPQLLTTSQIPGRFGFYGYQSNAGKIQFRRDILDRGANDTWKLTTRLAEGQPEQTGTFKPDGTMLQMTLPGGTQVEPTTLQSLTELWKKKGLPT